MFDRALFQFKGLTARKAGAGGFPIFHASFIRSGYSIIDSLGGGVSGGGEELVDSDIKEVRESLLFAVTSLPI